MKKRIFSLTLALLLLLSLLPLSAGASFNTVFTDVPEDHPADYAIWYVCENGLMNGVGPGKFDPDGPFTRAMFVTILGRMEGIYPGRYTGAPFSDVSTTDRSISWAAPYIQWAAENGIVNGVGHGKFDPNGSITKEQYCAIVFRYLSAKNNDTNGMMPASFWLSDGMKIKEYAIPAVRSLLGLGLIDVEYDRTFQPQKNMKRWEIAFCFMWVHNFLTTGYLPGRATSQACEVQDYNDILYAVRDSVQHEWDWYVDCSFTDKTQTIPGGTMGVPLEKVVAPGVHSRFDLNALSYDCFAPRAVRQLQEMKELAEKNGGLYISATEGLGGFIVDDCAIDAVKINDTVYEVTLIEYSGGETVNTVTLTYYLAENNRWVFSAPLPIDLQYATIAFG